MASFAQNVQQYCIGHSREPGTMQQSCQKDAQPWQETVIAVYDVIHTHFSAYP